MTLLEAAADTLRAIRTESDRACCVYAERVLERAFDLPPAEGALLAAWRLFDVRRPWSPVEAAEEAGITVATWYPVPPAPTVPPPPGRWALCQSWRRDPDANHDGQLDANVSGHTWLWRQIDATHGLRLDSATTQFRAAPGPELRGLIAWADQVRPYPGGVAVAALRPLRSSP